MSWSQRFRDDLAKSALAPMWRLDRVELHTEAGAALSIYSHQGALRIRRVRIDGAALNDYDLTTTWGRTVIEVVGNDLSELAAAGPRGTFFALYLGFSDYAQSEYERIAFGQLRQVSGRAPVWTIELIDLPTGLRQRPVNDNATALLFYNLEDDTLTDVDYVTTDTVLDVADTSLCERETGGNGAVLVTPTSGEPFYLRWTSKTASQLNVSTTDEWGTVRVDAATLSHVLPVALLEGHPIEIALSVLTSVGAGANGPHDVYPTSWGLALPVGYVDLYDANAHRYHVAKVASGTYEWGVIVTETQDDAFSWLQDLLRPGGFYLTMRQGCLTVRAQQQSIAPIADLYVWDITEADIVEASQRWWSTDHVTEYGATKVQMLLGSTTGVSRTVYQRPSGVVVTNDLSAVVWDNESEVRTEMLNRITESREITPESITLVLRGWWWAQMACGDCARVTTTRLYSRWFGAAGYDARRCKVVKVSPSWDGPPVTTVELLVYAPIGATWA